MTQRKIGTLWSVSILMVFASGLFAATQERAVEIVKKMDELYRSDSSYAEVTMKIETQNWQRELKIKSWSLGREKTFIRILSPKKERGIATLKLKNKMWNFLPKIDKIMKIPPSMMMNSWMGSDFTNDDFVKMYTFLEDYDFKTVQIDENRSGRIYVECIPKEGRPIVWGKRIIAVDENSLLPIWEKFYDGKEKLVRQMNYKSVRKFGKKTIPSVIELISLSKKGNKTIITYENAEFDLKIDKKTFSRSNLRKRI